MYIKIILIIIIHIGVSFRIILFTYVLQYFSDYYSCIHCKDYHSNTVKQLVEHGRKCTSCFRPDPFQYRFVCFACVYNSYCRSTFTRHVMMHLRNRPYKCLLCDYSSTQRGNLRRHVHLVHVEPLSSE